MARIKQQHPRAYKRWSDDEDTTLTRLFKSGSSVAEIAGRFQRQPSAIRSRLAKLGLVDGDV